MPNGTAGGGDEGDGGHPDDEAAADSGLVRTGR